MNCEWNRYKEGDTLPLKNDEDVWVTVEYPSGKREVMATWWHGAPYNEFSRQWDDGEDGEVATPIAWMKHYIPEPFFGKRI